ncbi:MAG: YolD-like family protein [Acholeplasma sp.]|nr:YolD-like family protein [Acholeplasma sp.]
MANYHDRGLMKWAPFDALAGYQEMIKEMVYIKNKREKPVLFEDTLEEMDRTVQRAFKLKSILRISYYVDGYLYYRLGEIKKYDPLLSMIILKPNMMLKLNDIINIEEIL